VYKTPYHNDENDGVFIILQVFRERLSMRGSEKE
jgi:hypothetical protein